MAAEFFQKLRAAALTHSTTVVDAMSTATEMTDTGTSLPDFASTSDADLLEAWVTDRHGAALATLINRYSVMVLSVCRRRCRTEADADDAFQTTFLYLARNGNKIRHPQRLAGWLHRVAQRAAVATLKSKKHQTEPMVDTPADPDDPLDRLTQRHEAIVLDEELAELPEHYRAALVMHIFDGQSLAKLAEHFGTTVGSIRGRLQRGKQLLGRRLRRCGVVPVLAFAAASAWAVPKTTAAEASQSLIDAAISDGQLPPSPIEPSLLNSLLNQGTSVMSSLYTVTGLVGGTALLALLLTTTNGISDERKRTAVSIPGSVNTEITSQYGGAAISTDDSAEPTKKKTNPRKNAAGAKSDGNVDKLKAPQTPPTKWVTKSVKAKPTSLVAEAASEALDKEYEFEIHASFIELPERLAETVDVPVLVDTRAVEFAKLLPSTDIDFSHAQLPLRTALRRMLRPLGLKAVVEDEGIVITADSNVLVHRGIGVSRWINIDNDAEEAIETRLDSDFAGEFIELPLNEALLQLSEMYSLSIALDELALEDVGLSPDLPLTFSSKGIKLRNALELMLEKAFLTYTIQGESLVITTDDADQMKILNRIYWLEGTGFAEGDYESIIEMITETIEPDAWSIVGGSSTISKLAFSRPALMIGTTYTTHQSIEQLLSSLRESHFGADPILESVEIPANTEAPAQFGGGFGGGGMGGGGAF